MNTEVPNNLSSPNPNQLPINTITPKPRSKLKIIIMVVLTFFVVIIIAIGFLAFSALNYMRAHPNGSVSFGGTSNIGVKVSIGPYANWNKQACYLDSGCQNFVKNYCSTHGGSIQSYTIAFGKGTIPCKFSNGSVCDASDFYQEICNSTGNASPTP